MTSTKVVELTPDAQWFKDQVMVPRVGPPLGELKLSDLCPEPFGPRPWRAAINVTGAKVPYELYIEYLD